LNKNLGGKKKVTLRGKREKPPLDITLVRRQLLFWIQGKSFQRRTREAAATKELSQTLLRFSDRW